LDIDGSEDDVTKHTAQPVAYPKKRSVAKQPRSRKRLYLAAVASATLVAAALVFASQFGNTGSDAATPVSSQLMGAADNAMLLTGIPQHGTTLGSPKAPVTLVEYADLQCPYCGEFARNALPTLIADYIRTGKVKLVFRGLAFVGPESEAALRASLAAGRQNHLWNFMHLLYENQGAENSGWVTDGFIRSAAGLIDGLDVTRLVADAQSGSVTNEIAAAQELAASNGVNTTPSFFVGRTGAALTKLEVRSLDPAAFRPTLDRLLE
jgi:protein-disulfide isomerase